VLSAAKRQLGEILSAVEFLDAASLSLATTLLPGVSNPLGNTGTTAAAAADAGQTAAATGQTAAAGGQTAAGQTAAGQTAAAGHEAAEAAAAGDGPMYMVIETQGSNEAHDKEKLESFLEVGFEKDLSGVGVRVWGYQDKQLQ
jgi:hypothetical protein